MTTIKKTSPFKESWLSLSTEEKAYISAEYEYHFNRIELESIQNEEYLSQSQLNKMTVLVPPVKKMLRPYVKVDNPSKLTSLKARLRDGWARNARGMPAYIARLNQLNGLSMK
jgi:hypothetical protein